MARILVVDDEPPVRRILGRILQKSGHKCVFACDAVEANAVLDEQDFDLVLSDVNMPGAKGSGLHLAKRMSIERPEVALLMVTGVDDPEIADQLLEYGADGYLIKPFEPNEIIIAVNSALRRRTLEIQARQYTVDLETAVVERTHELLGTQAELQLAQEETFQRVAKAAEFRDSGTAEHVQRMSRFCALLGREMGYSETECEQLRLASSLHDVGKIGIPDAILLKPGRLTREEFEEIKKHAEIGRRILGGSKAELLNWASEIAFTHHEKYDGSGYPRGIAAEEIPLGGRIAAVADVFDALTSKRVYKDAQPIEMAMDILNKDSGTHFDPQLVEIFERSMDEVLQIRNDYADLSIDSSPTIETPIITPTPTPFP